MLNRIPRLQPIQMPFKRVGGAFPAFQKVLDNQPRLLMIRGRKRDLDSIAGGEDDSFRRPQVLQLMQRFGKRVFRNSQLLPQVDRRGLVADSGEQQLH